MDVNSIINHMAKESGDDELLASDPMPIVQPSYKMVAGGKIPVSKISGKVWKSRKDQALAIRSNKQIDVAWRKALDYYNNDQMGHRYDNDPDTSGNEVTSRKNSRMHSETENIVYTNVRAIIRRIYSKNPSCEINPVDEDESMDSPLRKQSQVLQKLINAVLAQRKSPGLNFKTKAKRLIGMGALYDCAWLILDYTKKDESSEASQQDILTISKELAEAKEQKVVKELEGKLMALEEKVSVLNPSGPKVRIKSPHCVIVDPNSIEADLSDAAWLMEFDLLPTEYLKAVYGQKNEEGEWTTVFNPTHILKLQAGAANRGDADEDTNAFALEMKSGGKSGYQSYGYGSEDEYQKACMTKVWYVWDKTTRRVYLYLDNDWCYPLWAWDDPLKLDGFFPYWKLSLSIHPEGGETKGEVVYYLDQQDAVNEINSEEAYIRRQLRKNLVYDKNKISAHDVDRILKGDENVAIGVDLPEGMTIKDCIEAFEPPSLQHPQIFQQAKQDKMQAISRISSVPQSYMGGEYRTNTTNQAIEKYSQNEDATLDEKIDAVEDCLSGFFWGLAQVLLQFMSQEEVAAVIGPQQAQYWQQMTPDEINRTFNVSMMPGSSQKPTGEAKKRQALEIAQILGQFTSATPVAFLVAIKLFERTFREDVVITSEDWAMIRQSMEQALAPQEQAMPSEDAQPPQEEPKDYAEQVDQMMKQLAKYIDSMPPAAKQAFGTAIARGAPIEQTLDEITKQLNKQQPKQSNPDSGAPTNVPQE
jgi:hypothetical protein